MQADLKEGGAELERACRGPGASPSTGPWGPLPSRNTLNGPSVSPLCHQPPRVGAVTWDGPLPLG